MKLYTFNVLLFEILFHLFAKIVRGQSYRTVHFK